MAKASIDTGQAAQPVHTRTTAGSEESQVVVVGIDGSDSVVGADTGNGLDVDVTRVQGTVTVDSELTTKDFDSGGGTDTVAVSGLVVPASGGSVTIPGDASNGLDVDVTRVSGTVTTTSAGTVAHSDADSGNPVKVGGVYRSTLPTNLADGDRSDLHVDNRGRLITTREIKPVYYANIVSQVHVNSANTIHWDLFNADASLVVRILSIRQIPNITTAVTGIVFDWKLAKTTAVGTGGSTITPWLPDTNYAALDADITMRSKPSGGATEGTILFNYSLSSEETNAATIQIASQGGLELVPYKLMDTEDGIVLRQNQGVRVVQITASTAGNTGWLVGFTVE